MQDNCQREVVALRAFSDKNKALEYFDNKTETNPYNCYYINEVKLY